MSTLTVESSELRKRGFAERCFLRVVNWLKEEYRLTSYARIRSKAENGEPRAQYLLGSICETRPEASQRAGEAVKWYQKAAFQGVALAQLALGLKYLNGQGVTQSDTEALLWLRKAGEQGQSQAQYELGNLYLEGRGTTRDVLQASKWYRKAAERGHLAAKKNLQELTSTNFGNDPVEAAPRNEEDLAC